jgi:chemotaxis protein CheD
MMIDTLSVNVISNPKIFTLGLGEMKVAHSTSVVLSCLGIGSCIAFCVYDSLHKVGGMLHIVLPCNNGKPGENLARYADTGIPLLLREVVKEGGNRSHLAIKIAGGAQMSLAPGLKNVFKTGERNLEEVKMALEREKIPILAADVGGTKGRTVRLFLDTGRVTVKTSGGEDREI